MSKKLLFGFILGIIAIATFGSLFYLAISMFLIVPSMLVLFLARYGYDKNNEETRQKRVYYIPSLYLFVLIFVLTIVILGLSFYYQLRLLFVIAYIITIGLSVYGMIKEIKKGDIYD